MKITLEKLQLTEFAKKDIQALQRIRNHETVRKYMANPQPIDDDSHALWVRENLIGKIKLLLFMVRRNDPPLGFALLEKISEYTAEIGLIFKKAGKHPVVPYYVTVITFYIAFEYLQLS